MTKLQRVALYGGVFTDAQTTENPLRQLRAVADRNGWIVVAENVDRLQRRLKCPRAHGTRYPASTTARISAWVLHTHRELIAGKRAGLGNRSPAATARAIARLDMPDSPLAAA